jgi:hypothetical protein
VPFICSFLGKQKGTNKNDGLKYSILTKQKARGAAPGFLLLVV